ncbi:unnamed protein product [Rhodiola kirilowii]
MLLNPSESGLKFVKRKKLSTMKKSVTKKAVEKKKESNEKEIFAACSFASLGLEPTLCDQLRERMGFEAPTVVQAQAIPVILAGRHVLVNAATGTGKTVTYLAPIIHHLHKFSPRIERSDGTFALVLVPTHELCMQVYEILQKLLHRFHWIVPGYVMGGESRNKEKARLRKGISILIATPGRLLDHLKNTSSFMHANLRWIIFDEADMILELGFGKAIEEILDLLGSRKNDSVSSQKSTSRFSSSERQNVLLSATLNEKVNRLANISLEDPVMVGLDNNKLPLKSSVQKLESSDSDSDGETEHPSSTLTTSNGNYNLPAQLVQRYVKVPCGSRLVVLLSILKHLFENESSQKHEDRRTTFNAFKTEKLALLLSTDVSARGLDFPKVRYIIQYDSPGEPTEYVHRVGRTARMGERGDSLLFLQPSEMDYLKDLEKHSVSLSEYPVLKVLDSLQLHGQRPQIKKVIALELHPWLATLQRALESFVGNEPTLKQLAKDAFCSWVRAYAAHRGELKRIFVVKMLHLGHVARSFALKDQPSLVGRTHQLQEKKRKKNQKMGGLTKRRKTIIKK